MKSNCCLADMFSTQYKNNGANFWRCSACGDPCWATTEPTTWLRSDIFAKVEAAKEAFEATKEDKRDVGLTIHTDIGLSHFIRGYNAAITEIEQKQAEYIDKLKGRKMYSKVVEE